MDDMDKALETLYNETFRSIISLLICLGFSTRDIDLISKGLLVKCSMISDEVGQDIYNKNFDEILNNILKKYDDRDKESIDFLKNMIETTYFASKKDIYNTLRLMHEANEKFGEFSE